MFPLLLERTLAKTFERSVIATAPDDRCPRIFNAGKDLSLRSLIGLAAPQKPEAQRFVNLKCETIDPLTISRQATVSNAERL